MSGSDETRSGITRSLRAEGARVSLGHRASNILRRPPPDLAVYSQAVRPQNPEFRAAVRERIPLFSYPELIGRISRFYRTIAIAGSHGKSTTTALAALILMKGGLDPTVIIGTNLKEFGGRNFRSGRGGYLVLEADEYKEAFRHHSPLCILVTNIDREHLDHYRTFGNVKRAFLRFIARIEPRGILVLNRDDKSLFSLRSRITAVVKKKRCAILWYSLKQAESARIRRKTALSGTHNLSNALGAYRLGKALGVSEPKILEALGHYRGAWRRMEYRGTARLLANGYWRMAKVYDDYAHHPTEIRATLQAFREKYPNRPIICVFQPHQLDRLKRLFKEFTTAFEDADAIVLLPAYQVKGRDIADRRYHSGALAEALTRRYPRKPVRYVANPERLRRTLASLIRNPSFPLATRPEGGPRRRSCTLVMMGAGDIVNNTSRLVAAK